MQAHQARPENIGERRSCDAACRSIAKALVLVGAYIKSGPQNDEPTTNDGRGQYALTAAAEPGSSASRVEPVLRPSRFYDAVIAIAIP